MKNDEKENHCLIYYSYGQYLRL